jgi:predicted metal-dependent hydrolase
MGRVKGFAPGRRERVTGTLAKDPVQGPDTKERTMPEHVLPGDPPIAIDVRHSHRARRMSLRISRADGVVTLTLPKGAPVRDGLAFAADREAWLRRHLAEIHAGLMAVPAVGFGATIPFRGQAVTLVPGTVRRPVVEGGRLVLPPDAERVGARVQAFLRATARDALAAAADHHAARLGRPYGRLTLRDTHGRWGSCSSRGDLMFSWRLIMAPDAVLDYVVAHEVAHLAEMNHSPAFWAVVARLCPGYEPQRRWLRDHGTGLHAVRLAD